VCVCVCVCDSKHADVPTVQQNRVLMNLETSHSDKHFSSSLK